MNFNLAKVLTLSLLTFALNARAQDQQDLPPDTINKYGTAGCGLGSMMFGDKPGAVQILASIFNATFASQTFGISSGTSNCQFGRTEAMSFIHVNHVALAKDIAHGEGETLETFAKLVGCPSPELGAELKKNYGTVFSPGSDPDSTGAAIIDLIRADPKFQTCSQFTLG